MRRSVVVGLMCLIAGLSVGLLVPWAPWSSGVAGDVRVVPGGAAQGSASLAGVPMPAGLGSRKATSDSQKVATDDAGFPSRPKGASFIGLAAIYQAQRKKGLVKANIPWSVDAVLQDIKYNPKKLTLSAADRAELEAGIRSKGKYVQEVEDRATLIRIGVLEKLERRHEFRLVTPEEFDEPALADEIAQPTLGREYAVGLTTPGGLRPLYTIDPAQYPEVGQLEKHKSQVYDDYVDWLKKFVREHGH